MNQYVLKVFQIIKLNPQGKAPDLETNRLQHVTPEVLRCIPHELLQDQIKDVVVSEGKTQAQIDNHMEEIATKYAGVFKGMSRHGANTHLDKGVRSAHSSRKASHTVPVQGGIASTLMQNHAKGKIPKWQVVHHMR